MPPNYAEDYAQSTKRRKMQPPTEEERGQDYHIGRIQAQVGQHLENDEVDIRRSNNDNFNDDNGPSNSQMVVSPNGAAMNMACGGGAIALRPTAEVAVARTAGVPVQHQTAPAHRNSTADSSTMSSSSNDNNNNTAQAYSSTATATAAEDNKLATQILQKTGSVLHTSVEELTKNLGILVMKYPGLMQEDEMKDIQSTLLPGLSFLSDSMTHLSGMPQEEQRNG